MIGEHVADLSVCRADAVDFQHDVMHLQMPRQLLRGARCRDVLVLGHSDRADRARSLKKRYRIGDGACGRAAEVPGDEDLIKLRRDALARFGQDHHRAACAENNTLRIKVVDAVRVSHRDDGEVSQPFQSQAGWHIIQRTGSRQANVGEENRRNQVRETIGQRKLEDEWNRFLREMRSEAFIDIRPASGAAGVADGS